MTMTPERLAELDAVMAKATAGEWEIYGEPEVGLPPSLFSCETTTWPSRTPLEPLCRDDESAIVALHNAYADLRAHIDAQAATIEKLLMAIRSAVDDFQLVVERIDDNQIDRAKGTAMAGERAATRTVLTATGAA